jgi:two-component system, NarL family, sensor histidine kinase UhpB
MHDRDKTKEDLVAENEELRRQVALLQGIDAERKRAAEELRDSEAQLLEAQEVATLGFNVVDLTTGCIKTSTVLDRIFAIPADYERTLEKWADLVHPDERDWVLKFQEDFLASTSSTVSVEYRLRHRDGSYRWIAAHALVVRDEQGKARRLVGSHGDITDRKGAEESLERERRTLKHLLQSSDRERQLIAYEIHDGLAQHLAGAIMQFQVYEHARDTVPKDAANAFHAGMTMLQQSHVETRRLISGVRPPILDEAGIVAAISHLVNEAKRQKGPKIEYLSDVEFDRLTPILENAIYRIVQEALANACRHGKSKKIRVELVQHGDQIRIEVRDRGVGFNLAVIDEGHFGVAGIRERARLLGGKAIIESEPGKGTRIVVKLPIVLRRPGDEHGD